MVTLLIIADDFTGALDTGVKFAASGASVRVITDYEYDFACARDAVQVLVMDAETRHIRAEDAYQRICMVTERAKKAGIPYIYKKTDSALRGNIGSELSALLAASGNRILHFLPAFPKMGRTTCRGIHYINGVPVKESVFGQDPFEPVVCSDIPGIIGRQSGVKVQVVSDGQIVTESEEPVIVVYDAETDKELEGLAGKLAAAEQLAVLAGCAGMAETLPKLLNLTGREPAVPLFAPGFLVACGSVNPITRGQLDYAQRHGFERIRLTPRQKLDPGYFETDVGRARLRDLITQCREARRCILDTNDDPDGPDTMEYAREHGIRMETLRVQIATTLGYLVKCLVESGCESTLLITGGDSLMGFMNQAGVCEMIPICEMAPGTVLSQFEIKGRTYEVISKSGGFGNETLMVDLAEKILGKNIIPGKNEEAALC